MRYTYSNGKVTYNNGTVRGDNKGPTWLTNEGAGLTNEAGTGLKVRG